MPRPPNPKESADRPLASEERELLQRLMSHPMDFPPEFWAGLKGRLEVDPPSFMPSAVTNLRGEAWKVVGAGGMPAFSNSWAAFGGGFAAPAFYRDALGWVHLRGLLSPPATNNNAIFTLPERYRPDATELFAAYAPSGIARIDISTAGVVSNVFTVTSGGSGGYLSLSGISFRTP